MIGVLNFGVLVNESKIIPPNRRVILAVTYFYLNSMTIINKGMYGNFLLVFKHLNMRNFGQTGQLF